MIILAYSFYNEQIHFMNQMIIFQGFNKVCRRKNSHNRIHPSYQSLISTYFSGTDSYNRLIIYLDIFIFNRLINMIHNILLSSKLISYQFIIDTDVQIMSVLNTVAGQTCMITSQTDFGIAVLHIVNTCFDAHSLSGLLRTKNSHIN